ncbi:MAG TPA: prepilin-type N-terminal cleavage/methylation domain-containing protein [Woeseiaceae bacterium]
MRHGGFTLIALAVVVVVIGILAGFALDRLLPLFGEAERIAFLQVQNDLRSALMLEAPEAAQAVESRQAADAIDQAASSKKCELPHILTTGC